MLQAVVDLWESSGVGLDFDEYLRTQSTNQGDNWPFDLLSMALPLSGDSGLEVSWTPDHLQLREVQANDVLDVWHNWRFL